MIIKILFLIICCFSQIIFANTTCNNTTSSIEVLICKTSQEYQDLKLIGEVEILINASAPDTENVIDEARKRIKPVYSKAKNAVFFNNRAGDALNEFFVYWITIINDYHPYNYEDLSAYQQRMNQKYIILQEKANHLRITFE